MNVSNIGDYMSYQEKMESTLLELGAEIYRLKQDLIELGEQNEKIVLMMNGIKQIFDEKGLISSEDFEDAVQLGEALNVISRRLDPAINIDLDKIKKTSH